MKSKNYIKIIVNQPDRGLFAHLQKNILYEDVEMFYFPNLMEIEQFIQRIRPHVLITYVDPEFLTNQKIVEFLQSPVFQEIWMVFIASSKLSTGQLQELGEFRKSLVLFENTKPDSIVYNVKSILKQEKFGLDQKVKQEYARNLLKSSKIINQEKSITDIFEKLTYFLPKISPFDYWALFTFDQDYDKITEFLQFIPPHRRNIAVLIRNLQKLAESWLKRGRAFKVNYSEDKQLFRKLAEWGWGIKYLYFAPIVVENIPLGGLVLGNMNSEKVDPEDIQLIREIHELLGRKIFNSFRKKKSEEISDDFADQLIYNRFSEDSILQLSCKKINETSNAANTVFWQVNRGFGFLFPKFSYVSEKRPDWQSLEKNMLFLSKDQQLNKLVSTEKISLVDDLSENGQFDEATLSAFRKLGYHNLIIAPVRIENEEIGVFIANREEADQQFNAWDLDRVTGLMDKVQKVLEDTYVVKEANIKLKQLSRIFELGNEIKLDLKLEDILARISNSIRKTLGWNDVAVVRSNNFRQVYRPISKVGFDRTENLPIDILNNVTFRQFDKFLLNCRKISNSYFYDSHPLNINGEGTGFSDEVVSEWHEEDLLAIPVETRKKVLGYLVVRDPVDRLKPNEDKVMSLEYFANQAAVAMENAMLYENLAASEERYRSLAETMTLALVTCSADGKIIYVNPAFERLVGLNSKSLGKKSLVNFFSGESRSRFGEITQEILSTDEKKRKNIENVELELISTSGETIPVSTYAFPFYQHKQKIGVFLVLNDLRVVKKLERLKSDFNSMIVHDLRSPMNVIQGFIELIRTRVVGEINSEQEELLDIAKENVKKVLTLIDNFLVASKIEVGKFGIDPKVSEINPLVQQIIDNHQVLVNNKKIKLKHELNKNLPLLYFDGFRIEQVLNNFLSNAIKFTPEGGEIRITTDFYNQEIKGEKKMFARVGVHDTGPGIPAEKLKNVFEKYEQVDSELALKSSGTGLGLSICKEIVSLHGGEIWVDSEVGKGSHFYFLLPIEPSIDKFLK